MKVSVCVVTYNHEKYLAEALDSILMQEVEYPMEIEIGEDRSNDNTLAICEAYAKKYPDVIKLHINEKNLGYNWNFYRTMERCRGEYVAVLDGDDLWTDPQKLKKQIEFLDNNPEYTMCFSTYFVCDEASRLGKVTGFSGKYNLNDVLEGKCPGTRTVVFRKNFFPERLPDVFKVITYADHFLFALIAQKGPIYGFAEPMAAYRMSSESMYASKSMEKRSLNIIMNYVLMKSVFNKMDQIKAIKKGINSERIRLERHYFFRCKIGKLIGNSARLIAFDLRYAKISFLISCVLITKTIAKLITGRISLQQARM